MMGMDSTAKPDDDGTTKPSRKKISIMTRMKTGPVMPCTSPDDQNSSVSEMSPCSMIRLMPRASPIMSDTPTRLDAPWMNASTTFFSAMPDRNMMMIAMARNEAAICGNHQPWLTTPHTMMGNAATNSTRIAFFLSVKPVARASFVSPASTLYSLANFSRSS